MAVIIQDTTTPAGAFKINDKQYSKIFQPLAVGNDKVAILNAYDSSFQLLTATRYDEITVNTNSYASQTLLMEALQAVLFTTSAGGGGGSWGSITGTLSAQTDLQAALDLKADSGAIVAWIDVTGKPTTIAGFGITDAYTKTEVTGFLAPKVDNTLTLTAGTGLTGGGALTANRTFDVDISYFDGFYPRNSQTETISGTWTYSGIPAFNGGTSGVSAPFSVDSTQVVANLNADLLDGVQASSFVRSNTADTVSGVLTFTAIPAFNGGTSGVSAPFTVDSTQVVTNLNADSVRGYISSVSEGVQTIARRDNDGYVKSAGFKSGNFIITANGTTLEFYYNTTLLATLTSAGVLDVLSNITAG